MGEGETAQATESSTYYTPDKAAKEKLFPVGIVPRNARCWLTCDYQTSYGFPGATNDTMPDAIPAQQLGSPFHCQTKCDFNEPNFCNPTRRMMLGMTGMTPQENQCCSKCEHVCKNRGGLQKERLCNIGCRSFCPFGAPGLFDDF